MDRSAILRMLPESYQLAAGHGRIGLDEGVDGPRQGGALEALLGTMDALHAPVEARLITLDAVVDPYRAEPPLLFMLAGWMGLSDYLDWSGGSPGLGAPGFDTGIGRLRLLVGECASLAWRRGTRAALERFLFLATGIDGFRADDAAPGMPPFHVTVHAPAGALRHSALISRIVAGERPAHATFSIVFADASLTPE